MLQQFTTKLLEKRELASGVWTFKLGAVEPQKIDFKAGQYLITKIPATVKLSGAAKPFGRFYRRHFSIASPQNEKASIEFVVQMVNGGIASTYYKNLNIGDEVLYDGPAGVFTLKSSDRPKIFLATGTGIAPIRSILQTTLNSKFEARNSKQFQNSNLENSNLFRASDLGFRIYLFWGLRAADEVYFFNELKTLAEKNTNFKFKICLSRQEDFTELAPDYFVKGRVNMHLADFLKHEADSNNLPIKQFINKFEYYLCGNRIIIESLRQFILGMGIENQNIFFEKF